MRTRTLARYLIIATAFFVASSYRPATAQVILDMSLLTCGDYMAADLERQELVAAWMSGYFNASRNQPIVDLKRFATNKRLVAKYCKRRKDDNLMNAIRKAAF
jgi:acid stress chaperone HdeB